MKKMITVLFLCTALFVYGQSREDITVFVAMPVGGTSEQRNFFLENFVMETTAASYTVVRDPKNADYTLKFEIKNNTVLYENPDGSAVEEEVHPDDPDNKQFLLALHLMRNEDDTEIVYFEFPFTELEEMYEFNLFLLYQAMANVPLTKLGDVVIDDECWRNKWLYLRASFDYPISFYALKDSLMYKEPASSNVWSPEHDDHVIRPNPALTLGVEFHFLDWMSVEADFLVAFGDPMTNAMIPSIMLSPKFPLKPAKHFMIEPYGSVEFLMATGEKTTSFPTIALGGGCQFGVKGGSMGAFFVDVNFRWGLGEVRAKHGRGNANRVYNSDHLVYDRFVVGLGIGYKVGFFNRPKH